MLLIQPQPDTQRGFMGIGDVPTIAAIITDDLNSRLNGLAVAMEQGYAMVPSDFQTVLQNDVNSLCINWTSDCGNANALIAQAVAQYTTAYQQEYLRVTQGQSSGTIYLPPSYVPPTPIYTTPPTVLNPPTPVYIPPQPTGSVLNPPQGTNAGVTPGTVVNTQSPPPSTTTGTQQQTTVQGTSTNWFTDSTEIGGMSIPNFALVGAAGLALLLLMGKK